MQKVNKLYPPGFGTWLQVGRTNHLCCRRLAALLQPLGLTVPQHDALARLFTEDGITQQDLANRLLLTKGDISGLIQRLIDKGWVERRAGKHDRRTKCIFITKAGKNIARRALIAQSKQVEVMMVTLSEAERHSLRDMMKRIESALADFDPAEIAAAAKSSGARKKTESK